MTEPRRLVEVFTFGAANEMIIDDLAKLMTEAEERAKAAQIAGATEPNPPERPNRPVMRWRLGGLASGWF
jgi:hypothetical protein